MNSYNHAQTRNSSLNFNIMETYIASRLTAGNKVYPAEVIIEELGVTLKIPGFWGGNEKTIPYSRIASVDISCPLVGYSTIVIGTTGEGSIKAYGFRKNQVERMKEQILSKIHSA